MRVIPSYKHLSDAQLIGELTRVVQYERRSTIAVLRCLEEFDRRRLYLGLGFCSLYGYCRERLHLSEDAGYTRIVVARASRRCPRLLDMVHDGRLSLTTACLVAKHLSSDRFEELLRQSVFKSRRQVEVVIATMFPKPPVPSVVRKLPDVKPMAAAAVMMPASGRLADAAPAAGLTAAAGPAAAVSAAALAPGAALSPADMPATPLPEIDAALQIASSALPLLPPDASSGAASPISASVQAGRRSIVAPLSAAQYRLQVTISAVSRERLQQIQDLMRHQLPTGDPAVIVERALELLHADLLKRKAAQVSRPRAASSGSGAPEGRRIPASVMRAVWRRDQARCAFIGDEGKKCGSTSGLEFHHVRPFAVGGGATVENIELRCRAHNVFEWERHLDQETAALAGR